MDILLDTNIILDLLLKRENYNIAHRVYSIISSRNFKIWIAASSVVNLYHVLHSEGKRLKSSQGLDWDHEDRKRIDNLFKGFIEKVSIFSIEPKSIRIALTEANDLENMIVYSNFKRISQEGIFVSTCKKFVKMYSNTISPEEFIENYKDLKLRMHEMKPKVIPLLDLKAEYRYMMEDIDHSILNTVAEAKYILGPQVKELEEKVAKYVGVKFCVGVSSGTDALVLALRALAIKLKEKEYFDTTDEIITSPFTFTATGDAILRAGATPVFVDIDPISFNIDPEKIKSYLNTSTKVVGIIPVHLYGQACNMDEIMEIAENYNLFVLEDVAQAFGGMWKDKKLGSIGTSGIFSFFPSKNLGGFGDGGMIATNDNKIAELIKMLLRHGGKDKYNVDHIGYNARIDTLQAAIILAKFKYIEEFNERRKKIAEIYNNRLIDIKEIILPTIQNPSSVTYHVYHQYSIRVTGGKRNNLQKYLKDKGISTMVYYPVPLHKMKVFESRMKLYGDLKNAEDAPNEVLSLPIEPLQKEEDLEFVIKNLLEFWKQ